MKYCTVITNKTPTLTNLNRPLKTLPPTASRKQLSENDGQDLRIILQPSFLFCYKNNDVLR